MGKRERKYLGEYMVNPSATGPDNKVIYVGKPYVFDSSKERVKKAERLSFLFSVCAFVLFAVGGIQNSAASFKGYVILPYVIAFLPLVFLISKTFSALGFENYITHKQYDITVKAQKPCAIAASVFVGVSLFADIVMYFFTENIKTGDIIFTVCAVLVIAYLAVVCSQNKHLTCTPQNK